jgi:protein TonB
VKSSIGTKKQSHAEDVAPPLPSAIASASPNGLSSLIAAPTPTMPKPTLATVRISQGVSQGLLIKRVPPKYPPAARATHTQGEVRIEATINKEGNVVNPKVIRGDAVLAHAALEAVRQWRYKPYYLDGAPVEIQTDITINFKAD